jgi:hypothetical protein
VGCGGSRICRTQSTQAVLNRPDRFRTQRVIGEGRTLSNKLRFQNRRVCPGPGHFNFERTMTCYPPSSVVVGSRFVTSLYMRMDNAVLLSHKLNLQTVTGVSGLSVATLYVLPREGHSPRGAAVHFFFCSTPSAYSCRTLRMIPASTSRSCQ